MDFQGLKSLFVSGLLKEQVKQENILNLKKGGFLRIIPSKSSGS